MPGRTPLWGGRFSQPLDPAIHAFTNSLPFDRRLARFDLLGSLAHARMLTEGGIIDADDGAAIVAGLVNLLGELERGEVAVTGEHEDVHSWVEDTLRERVGAAAGWLHTARSRNDQTGLALRLYLREACVEVLETVMALQAALLDQVDAHTETWLPGYTHLQRAQPVSLAHHLLAHVASLEADVERWKRVHRLSGVSPLGAGALAGTSFPILPARVVELLGLEAAFSNSMHAVADRDYVIEATFAAAMTMLHLSRWADEVILWATREFGFIELSDSISQGSSLMPQKKNPEAAEILRGKSARVIGDLTTLLSLLKGLPLTYNSDLQEDKEPLFDALDTTLSSLAVARTIVGGLRYRPDRMADALGAGLITATELADELVRSGVPFRIAHEQVGAAVREAEAAGVELWALPAETLGRCCPGLDPGAAAALTPEAAVRRHDSPGGPSPDGVRAQSAAARERSAELAAWLEALGAMPLLDQAQGAR